MITTVDLFEVISSFLVGLAVGIAVQYVRFKQELRIEKIKRLSPHLERAYPIIEKLGRVARYGVKAQESQDTADLDGALNKFVASIVEYAAWFSGFREGGMVPVLESLDSELSARFTGVSVYANGCRAQGQRYLYEHIQDFADYVTKCEKELKKRLSE